MPSVPPRLALALVVHGSGIGERYPFSRLRRRRYDCAPCGSRSSPPVWFPVPPAGYGGIELVVALLTDGFVDSGHDVTLFAPAGSRTKASLVTQPARAARPQRAREPVVRRAPRARRVHASRRLRRRPRPRRRHGAGVRRDAAAAIRRSCTRCTVRGPTTRGCSTTSSASTSTSSRSATRKRAENPDGQVRRHRAQRHRPRGVSVPHGEGRVPRLHRSREPGQGTRWRRSASRGRPACPLQMILKRGEAAERAYFDHEINPLLGHDVELFENVSHAEKVDLLGSARALLFPIRWPEPFGLVMVEAMACGTPVVTTNWGAAPEIVADGVTGFRRDSADDLAARAHTGRRPRSRGLPGPGRGALLRRGHGPRLRDRLRDGHLSRPSRTSPARYFSYRRSVITMAGVNDAAPTPESRRPRCRSRTSTSPSTGARSSAA